MQTIAMTTEIQVLAWSVILLIVHIAAQGVTTTMSVGLNYNMSARDKDRELRGMLAPRFKRALDNYKETWPAFIALALGLAVTGKSGGIGATGAMLWIIARVVYLPIYALGIPVIRTLTWVASIVGIVMMLIRLLS